MAANVGSSVWALAPDTVSQIVSGQILPGPSGAVKELMENALDAGAQQIHVHLEDYGLASISVSDDGSGVASSELARMTQAHCTSKIRDFSDLADLSGFGFRGEALHAICQLAKVEIRSKSRLAPESQSHGWSIGLDPEAREIWRQPFVMNPGTTVIAREFFHRLPVRRKLYQSSPGTRGTRGTRGIPGRNGPKKRELKRIETLCRVLALSHPQVRIGLFHDRKALFQKPAQSDERSAVNQVFGPSLGHQLRSIEFHGPLFSWTGFLPSGDCDPAVVSRATPDQTYLTINRRWVDYPPILKLIRRLYHSGVQVDKYPVGFIALCVGPGQMDVNLDPNKYVVLLQDEQSVLDSIQARLKVHFQRHIINSASPEADCPSPCSSLDSSINRSIFDQIEARPLNLREPLADPEDQNPEVDEMSQDFDVHPNDPGRTRKVLDNKKFSPPRSKKRCLMDLKENQPAQECGERRAKENGRASLGSASQNAIAPNISGSWKKTRQDSMMNTSKEGGTLRQKTLDAWSHGQSVVDGNGDFVAPVALHSKKPQKTGRPESSKPILTVRRSGSSTSRGSNSATGNDTLEQMVAPYGTPILDKKTVLRIGRKHTTIPFSMTLAKRHWSVKGSDSGLVSWSEPQLVGQLSGNGFGIVAVSKGNEESHHLGVFNHGRAEEVHLFRNLMANYQLKSNVLLKEPLEVMACSNLGEDDPRFVGNGLGLKVCRSTQKTWLISIPSVVHSLGLDDVMEINAKIRECPRVSLELCRPKKVQDYFKAEALRLTRQKPPIKSRTEVMDLLRLNQDMKRSVCLHGRPIIERFFDLDHEAAAFQVK